MDHWLVRSGDMGILGPNLSCDWLGKRFKAWFWDYINKMKFSALFLILFLTGVAVKAETIVQTDQNMVVMKEKHHVAETGFVTSTIKPNSLTMEPTIKEIDPTMLNDQLVDMETRVQEEQKILQETRELERIEKELPAMQEACQKKKHESLDLNKQIIDLKEILEKSKKDVREGKITAKSFQNKTFETEKKITTLESKKADVDKLAKDLDVKVKEQEEKAQQIKSRLDKKIEKNPARLEKDKRSQIIEKCKDHINRKELSTKRFEKLTNEAKIIRERILRETSTVIKRELAQKEAELVKEIKKVEEKVNKLETKIKNEKKIIRESTKALKEVQKAQEKEKLRDLVKGECTAHIIRPHKRYCLKKDAKGICAQWGSIYRTEKCVRWNGDKCAEFNYTYSKKNGRYECASRDHTYKVDKCVKLDTQGKCLGKKVIYGTKKCITYNTNNGELVCQESKVFFPQVSCKTKVGDVCTELEVHETKFFCQTFRVNKDGHRFCHKYDVIHGENNFDLECLKEGTHEGKDVGCLEYKKVEVKGAVKLMKMSKTWLKENCKALNKNPVTSIVGVPSKKSVEENGNKNAVITETERVKDAEAEKVIENCKRQIKEKLKVIRESNRIVGGRTETVVPKSSSELITENSKIMREEAKKERDAMNARKQQEIATAQEEARKEIKIIRNQIAEENEKIFKSEKTVSVNENLIKQAKDNKIVISHFSNGKEEKQVYSVPECQKKIEEAKAIITESKKRISTSFQKVKKVESDLKTKIGKESSRVVVKRSGSSSVSESVVSKCNKKIVDIKARIAVNEAKLAKATGAEKSKITIQIAQDRNRISKLESKKVSKTSSTKIVGKLSRKIIRNERSTLRILRNQLKNTTDAAQRKTIISEIRKSKRAIYKAETLLLERGSSKNISKNLNKIVSGKKSKIAKIQSRIEKLRKETQTPATLKKIEKLTKKAKKIERQIKKLERVAERAIVKRSSLKVAVEESSKIVSGKKETVSKIKSEIERLRKEVKTPETTKRIERLVKKARKIERQISKIEKIVKVRVARQEKAASTKIVFKSRRPRLNRPNISITQVRKEVAQKNAELRKKSNNDLRIIREDKTKIIRLQQQLKSAPAEKKAQIINAIKETQDDIEAKTE